MSVLAVRARFGLLGSPYLFEVGIRLCSELAAVALQRQFRLEESRSAAVPVRLSDIINLTVRLIQVHGDFGLRLHASRVLIRGNKER